MDTDWGTLAMAGILLFGLVMALMPWPGPAPRQRRNQRTECDRDY